MSFFNEFINYFKLDDLSGSVSVSLVFGVGVVLLGKLKIVEVTKEKIVFKEKQKTINVMGIDLCISSIAKGEIVILGNVQNVGYGDV